MWLKWERNGRHAEFWWGILVDDGYFEVRKGNSHTNCKDGHACCGSRVFQMPDFGRSGRHFYDSFIRVFVII
jgi:hypothetical protein